MAETPNSSSNAWIMASESAAPPTMTRFKARGLRPALRISSSRPIHTVGTPWAQVTFSASINSKRDFPSSARPGITSAVPPIGAA